MHTETKEVGIVISGNCMNHSANVRYCCCTLLYVVSVLRALLLPLHAFVVPAVNDG